jgi:hypothetical protein
MSGDSPTPPRPWARRDTTDTGRPRPGAGSATRSVNRTRAARGSLRHLRARSRASERRQRASRLDPGATACGTTRPSGWPRDPAPGRRGGRRRCPSRGQRVSCAQRRYRLRWRRPAANLGVESSIRPADRPMCGVEGQDTTDRWATTADTGVQRQISRMPASIAGSAGSQRRTRRLARPGRCGSVGSRVHNRRDGDRDARARPDEDRR